MTPSPTAAVIQTGCANLASVLAALRRAGAVPVVTQDPHAVFEADLAVLPGVGAFGPAMAELRAAGLDNAIRSRISAARATLAICLGLQLLCSESEEAPGVAGLRIIPARVTRFMRARTPQLGWNRVTPAPDGMMSSGFAYFANSYKLDEEPPGWRGTWSDHGGPFIAALQRGPVLACQFHPELSGAWGASLIAAWARAAAGEETTAC